MQITKQKRNTQYCKCYVSVFNHYKHYYPDKIYLASLKKGSFFYIRHVIIQIAPEIIVICCE